MSIMSIGIDLAKNIFAGHDVDENESSQRSHAKTRSKRLMERPGIGPVTASVVSADTA